MKLSISAQSLRLDAENVFSSRSGAKRICNTLREHRRRKTFICAKSISSVINSVDEQADAAERL